MRCDERGLKGEHGADLYGKLADIGFAANRRHSGDSASDTIDWVPVDKAHTLYIEVHSAPCCRQDDDLSRFRHSWHV